MNKFGIERIKSNVEKINIFNPTLYLPFEGTTPYETNFDVNIEGQYGQRAVVSGGVIGRPGKFGKAYQSGIPATNVIENPRFEVDVTTLWNFGGSGAGQTRERDTTKAYIGSASAKITAGSDAVWFYPNAGISVAAGAYVTIQARVWRDSTVSANFSLYDHTHGVARLYVDPSIRGDWEHCIGTWYNNTGVTVWLQPYFYNWSADSTSVYWLDAVQLEAGAIATPYLDGSLGQGHSWSGTAHASSSSRVYTNLYYPDFKINTQGSISFWTKIEDDITKHTSTRFLDFRNMSNGLEFINLNFRNDTNRLYINFSGNDGVTGTADTNNFSRHEWHHIVAVWDSVENKSYLYLDGSLFASGVYYAVPTLVRVCIGHRYSSTGLDNCNGRIDDFAIFDKALTAAEVKSIYASNQPLTTSTVGTANTSGTVFPSAPMSGQRFFRTDLGLECYYDGTRWLTVNEYVLGSDEPDSALSASGYHKVLYPKTAYYPYLTRWAGYAYLDVTNNGSNYWTIDVRTGSAEILDTVNSSTLGTSMDWIISEVAGVACSVNLDKLGIYCTKTGSPSNLYVSSFCFYYRLIIT